MAWRRAGTRDHEVGEERRGYWLLLGKNVLYPCFLAYSSRLLLILCTHAGSALGSITVTITTGGPLPIATLGMFAGDHPPPCEPRPLPPRSHSNVQKPSMPTTTIRSLSLRNRFFNAGGSAIELWFRAAYGGGREVFRGGIAKCMVWEDVVRGQGC